MRRQRTPVRGNHSVMNHPRLAVFEVMSPASPPSRLHRVSAAKAGTRRRRRGLLLAVVVSVAMVATAVAPALVIVGVATLFVTAVLLAWAPEPELVIVHLDDL